MLVYGADLFQHGCFHVAAAQGRPPVSMPVEATALFQEAWCVEPASPRMAAAPRCCRSPCRTTCAAGAPSYRDSRAAACTPASSILCTQSWPRHTYTCVRQTPRLCSHSAHARTRCYYDKVGLNLCGLSPVTEGVLHTWSSNFKGAPLLCEACYQTQQVQLLARLNPKQQQWVCQ
jgi:hypothetical protein